MWDVSGIDILYGEAQCGTSFVADDTMQFLLTPTQAWFTDYSELH